jgi:hypothetical protein
MSGGAPAVNSLLRWGQIATADLLCEGKYAELMQERPHTGSTMVSRVQHSMQSEFSAARSRTVSAASSRTNSLADVEGVISPLAHFEGVITSLSRGPTAT